MTVCHTFAGVADVATLDRKLLQAAGAAGAAGGGAAGAAGAAGGAAAGDTLAF